MPFSAFFSFPISAMNVYYLGNHAMINQQESNECVLSRQPCYDQSAGVRDDLISHSLWMNAWFHNGEPSSSAFKSFLVHVGQVWTMTLNAGDYSPTC